MSNEEEKSNFEIFQKFLGNQNSTKKDKPRLGTLANFTRNNIENTMLTGFLSWDLSTPLVGGRMYEIYGPESSGKTAITIHLLEKLQMKNPFIRIFYFDAEGTLSENYLKRFKFFNQKKIGYSDNMIVEHILNNIDRILEKELADIIVVDSIGALLTKEEDSKSSDQNTMASLAGKLTTGIKKINRKAGKAVIIFINQLRDEIKNHYKNERTPGGRALKFFSSGRVRTKIINSKTRGDLTQGYCEHKMRIENKKNKVAPPFKTTHSYLNVLAEQKYSMNHLYDLVENALDYNLIEQKGSWYVIKDSNGEEIDKAHGQENLEKKLAKEPDLYSKVKMEIYYQGMDNYRFYLLYDQIKDIIINENKIIKKHFLGLDLRSNQLNLEEQKIKKEDFITDKKFKEIKEEFEKGEL